MKGEILFVGLLAVLVALSGCAGPLEAAVDVATAPMDAIADAGRYQPPPFECWSYAPEIVDVKATNLEGTAVSLDVTNTTGGEISIDSIETGGDFAGQQANASMNTVPPGDFTISVDLPSQFSEGTIEISFEDAAGLEQFAEINCISNE